MLIHGRGWWALLSGGGEERETKIVISRIVSFNSTFNARLPRTRMAVLLTVILRESVMLRE